MENLFGIADKVRSTKAVEQIEKIAMSAATCLMAIRQSGYRKGKYGACSKQAEGPNPHLVCLANVLEALLGFLWVISVLVRVPLERLGEKRENATGVKLYSSNRGTWAKARKSVACYYYWSILATANERIIGRI